MGAVILTKIPLAASAVFTQSEQDRFRDQDPTGGIRGLIYSDQAGTLVLEESDDGASWSTTATVSVSAATTAKLDWTSLTKRWYRFKYTNGATAQTKFVLVQQVRGMELADVQLSASIEHEGWAVSASADNALATATKAAVAGKSHRITAIFASYSGSKTGLLQIKDGAAVIFEQYIVNADVISLPAPLKITAGNAVSAELAASGTAGILGKVNLAGFTA